MSFPTNGGWMFRQPQTGWLNPMAMVGEDASIDAIRNHRLANPAIVKKFSLSTDRNAIRKELHAFNQARGALAPPQPTFFEAGRSRLPVAVAAAATNIKRAAQGTAVVLDWLGAGGDPVPQELAEKRAAICVACPKNVPGSWYTEAPAELIREAVKGWQALKGNSFSFETSQNENLKSCDVCKCLNRLKVWCPMDHIVTKTKPEVMSEFPEHCWIAKRQ